MKFKIRKPTRRPSRTTESKLTLERLISIITVLMSLATIVFSVIQYNHTQSMLDIRKYNNDYYDERYSVLKSLSHSLSEIPVTVLGQPSLQSPESMKVLLTGMSNFNYALLVLDETNRADKEIISKVEEYQSMLFDIWSEPSKDIDRDSFLKGDSLGLEIIKLCGKRLKNEKDSINSFHFSWWPSVPNSK